MTESPNDERDHPDAKAAWSEAGERLSGLGSRLRQHYQEHAQAPASGSAEHSGTQVKDAANRLNQAVHSAFEALASASKDPSVKDDARRAGRSVADALAGTFAGLSGELSKTFGDKGKAGTAPAPPPPAQPAQPAQSAQPAQPAQPAPAPAAPPASEPASASLDPAVPEYGSPESSSSPAGFPPGVPAEGSPEAGLPADPQAPPPA